MKWVILWTNVKNLIRKIGEIIIREIIMYMKRKDDDREADLEREIEEEEMNKWRNRQNIEEQIRPIKKYEYKGKYMIDHKNHMEKVGNGIIEIKNGIIHYKDWMNGMQEDHQEEKIKCIIILIVEKIISILNNY
jgi:hypothetical protein